MKDFVFSVCITYGFFNLFCADFPLKTNDTTKIRCGVIAIACFLLAGLLK